MASSNRDGGSRTVLWCVPRSISTALAKCLSFIEDNEVWFEPYAYSYLSRKEYSFHTKCELPMEYKGNEEVFQKAKEFLDRFLQTSVEPDRLPIASVKHRLEATTTKHVFVKDMSMAMTEGYRRYLPRGYRHTFLIRHPIRMIFSYRNALYKQFSELGEATDEKAFDVERDDRFFPPGCYVKELYDLWKHLITEGIDPNPIVIDADDLLTKPAETLSAYCAAVGLPYNYSLLQWDSSTDSLKKMKAAGDNVLLDVVNIFGTAMKSHCFLPASKFPSSDQLTTDVIRCSDKVMKYYEEMYETRIKV